jgi:hypothetical protein
VASVAPFLTLAWYDENVFIFVDDELFRNLAENICAEWTGYFHEHKYIAGAPTCEHRGI